MAKAKKNLIVTLQAQAEEFDFNKLRAAKDNKGANSGATMYVDFPRMNFVINGKEIDKNFITTLKEGTKDYKSELFSKDDIYNPESGKEREIDTDQSRAFVDSVLKALEKEHAQDVLRGLWDKHCKNPEITDHQKTDAYKKEFERFYNAGQEYKHLLPKKGDENKNYRPFAKEVFKEMFKHVGAKVPNDSLLEELVTNCNQAGYEAGIFTEFHSALSSYGLIPQDPKKVLNINYTDHTHIRIKSDMAIPVNKLDNPEEKICDLSSLLEFTLESQDGKDGVTYKNGRLSLTAPRELENYYAVNEKEQLQSNDTVKKSLLDVIIKFFLSFIEKFVGIKLKNKQVIYNETKNTLNLNNSSKAIVIKDTCFSPIRIECRLEDPLKLNSYLENVEPPVHSNRHVHGG
ncbi:hypothetical protein [Wolbachia pipientis]|uniref:hypothetical protein n=1 Tax=Wolbachia pipientis TaxID=955 RepID=UPI0025A44BC8|nr:hypothetical protein [Wolbachia pipientis]MDM8334839.1 hypothetical protein [Wolbachia pipientis]